MGPYLDIQESKYPITTYPGILISRELDIQKSGYPDIQVSNNIQKQFLKENRANYLRNTYRQLCGRGGSGNVQEGPYMPGERFWNRGINLKKSQQIEILKNRYNTSFAWSYGSGVGTVKIPVKNCIDSWVKSCKIDFWSGDL